MSVFKIVSAVLLIWLTAFPLKAQQAAEIPYHNLYVNLSADLVKDFKLQNSADNTAPVKKKSAGMAVLLSLVLPGSGEWYMGKTGQTKVFMGIEALLWGGLFANKWYVGQLEDDYKTYAVQYAEVNRAGKDYYYWVNIGKFNNIEDFNTQRARDRWFSEMYEDLEKYHWNWKSKSYRLTYDGKRLHAEDVKNMDVYFYSAIVLNHLVSAVNALRLARKHNKTLSWRMDVDAYVNADRSYYYGFSFSKRF
jgi:hypothetical protein